MTADADMVHVMASTIYHINKAAHDRGVLSCWTVYDHPKDYPQGFIARCFETGGGLPEPVATGYTVTGTLAAIRASMTQCGLYCLTRNEGDPANVVETWL